jgi:hypothetical protein
MQLAKKVFIVSALFSTSVFAESATRSVVDGLSLSVGADYSTGKYGSNESTDVYFMPFAATYNTGKFTYKLTIPYIRVTGPGDVIPGGLGGTGGSSSGAGAFGCPGDNRKGATKPADSGPCAGVTPATPGAPATATQTRSTESGLGDIVAAATYNVLDNEAAGFYADVTGRVKFPTASESKGLGSGETDYAVQGYVEKNFGAPFVSLGLGYKWLGEPAGVSYKNVTFGSLGAGYKFSKTTTVDLSYDWATAAVSGAERPQEISANVSHWINDHYKLNGIIYTGLSDANADVGGGVTLAYYF